MKKKPNPGKRLSAQDIRWHLLENPAAISAEACRRILLAAKEAHSLRDRFRVALAGGGTPEPTYRLLTGAETDWMGWEIYFTDERCLPIDDPRRNSFMVRHALVDHVSLPPENFHPFPAERGPVEGARLYAPLIEKALPFDLVLLGLGEDGHTASLFPGHITDSSDLVHPVFASPKPPAERITLSAEALGRTRHVLVLVCGEGKRKAVEAWRRGEDLPISRIFPPCPVDVLIDVAAAGTDGGDFENVYRKV